jgi:hypothetical protein
MRVLNGPVQHGELDRPIKLIQCKLAGNYLVEIHCTGFDYVTHDLRIDLSQALFMKSPVTVTFEVAEDCVLI